MKNKAKNGERERSRATVLNVSVKPSFFLQATVFLSLGKKKGLLAITEKTSQVNFLSSITF